jgi:hypothetical protein
MTKGEERALLGLGFRPAAIERIRKRKGCPDLTLRDALLEERAKRKGVFGMCLLCEGDCVIPNRNPAVGRLYAGVDLYQEWQPIEPPAGEGWQLWAAGEGPISPVFATASELASWCAARSKDSLEAWQARLQAPIAPTPSIPTFRLPSEHVRVYGPAEDVACA